MIDLSNEQEWLIFEFDDFRTIIPNPDTKPHGIKSIDGLYEISDRNPFTCECKPKVITSSSAMEQKMLVVHESFRNRELTDLSTDKIFDS